MLVELGLATLMVVLTVAIHGAGLHALAKLLRLEAREEANEHISPVSLRGYSITILAILSLFTLHGAEIWLYAFLYLGLGAVDGLREAVYFRRSRMERSDTAIQPWLRVGGSSPLSRASMVSSCLVGRLRSLSL